MPGAAEKTAAIREKKGIYHAVWENYAEMGAWLGILPFCVLAVALPRIWYVWIVLAVIGGVIMGRAGKRRAWSWTTSTARWRGS